MNYLVNNNLLAPRPILPSVGYMHAYGEYNHVLPGTPMRSPGDRRVSSNMAYMNSPSYKYFEKEHDSYLAIVGLNLLILTGVIVLLTHLVMVLSGQKEFKSSTIGDILDGPFFLVIVAGLTGAGLLFGHMGVSEKLYTGLYIPFGIIVVGTALWSIFESSPTNEFILSSTKSFDEFAPESMMWIGIAIVVLMATVAQWVNGKYRLDAMKSSGTSTFVFIFTVILFTFGLSKVFALVIRTLNFSGYNKNSIEYGGFYVMAIFGIMVLIISSIKFLDTCMTFFGGHIGTIFAPPSGIGASKAIMETQRAFKLALYTVIFLTAALIWRRRGSVVLGEEADKDTKDSLLYDWGSVVGMIIMVPVFAMMSEAMKEWFDEYSPVYDFIRAVIFSAIIVFVGIGYIPWNVGTITLAGAILVYMSLKFADIRENYDKPMIAGLCAALFVFSVHVYDLFVDPSSSDIFMKWVKWFMFVVGPAFLLYLLFLGSRHGFESSYGVHVSTLYFIFTIVYSFVIQGNVPVIEDDPNYKLVPENNYASMAVDGIILMASLMTTAALWSIITSSSSQYSSGIKLKTTDKYMIKLADNSGTVVIGYIVMGVACAYIYTSMRHDRGLSTYARKSQLKAEELTVNVIKDTRQDLMKKD